MRHLGPPAPTPPHAPGPLAFSDPGYVRSILEKAGFTNVVIDRETPDIIGSTPEEEAEYACIMGPPARLIDEKKPDDAVRETIRREMVEAFAAYARGKADAASVNGVPGDGAPPALITRDAARMFSVSAGLGVSESASCRRDGR